MVHFVYSDSPEPYTGPPVPYDRQNACRTWLRHYESMCYLRFVHDHKDTSFAERRQAAKEMDVCQAKLDRAQRHRNWSLEGIQAGRIATDRKWGRV